MAKNKISEYSSTSSSNTDIGSVNIAEGCAPSGINNAIRILMSQLKNFQDGSAGDNVTVGGNLYVTGTSTMTGAITASGGVNGNLTSSSATITGGTINGAVIGGSSAQAITGTNVTATVGFTGPLTGAVTGNVTGNVTGAVTGNVTGNLTGNVTGNVTAASGTSTFNNVTISGSLDMDSGTSATITGLASPTNDSDAATKGYVDALAQGIDAKASVVVATTANITLSGTQTIDGIAVSVGDRVLVKDQSTASQNGIYVVASSSWTRATDADTWTELVAAFTFVEKGTTNSDSGWICTVDAGGTIGTTSVTFAQFSGAGQITAGAGMVKSGNTLNVQTASSSRIVVGADEIDLASTGVSAGTYKSVTTDVYGRITAGTNPTTLSGFGITDTYTSAQIDTIFGSTSSAATSAAAAATSASNAATSATNASTSAGNASSSATAAAASATAAANTYDAFDDRYLGSKSSAPSVDNDGNALLTGALYWNTSVNTLYVWTGSTWTQAAFTASGFATLTGTETLTNKTLQAPNITSGLTLSGAAGTSGQVLTSAGTGAAPTWSTIAAPSAATPTVLGTVYGRTNTTSRNTSFGYQASNSLTTGTDNVAIGYEAGLNSTGNSFQVLVGRGAGRYATQDDIVAVGAFALQNNTTGYGNTGVGSSVLSTITSGQENTAVGNNALAFPTATVSYNTAIGSSALSSNTSGQNNTALGRSAGSNITTGSNNLILGYNSAASSATVSNENTFGNSSTTSNRFWGDFKMGGSSAGTSGQVLTSAGSGAAPTWSTPATSAPPTQQRFTTPGSATWTKPSGCKTIFVQLVGGGGNGGLYWGASGGYSQEWIDVTAVSTVAVTVGAGATTSSGNGGTTSFGAYLSATGGTSQTDAGIGSGGDLNMRGYARSSYQGGFWSSSGSTPMGTGAGINGVGSDVASSGYGGGGIGSAGFYAGGGAVFVTEFY